MMTETEYLMAMYRLRDELERTASAEPYDPESHSDALDKIRDLNRQWSNTLVERRRIKNILCVAAILFVLYLVYCVVREGFF